MAHLLLVDDNEEALVLLQKGLEMAGHQVFTATNGQEALDTLAAQPVDCVVTDVLMPEMDGFQLCREVRRDPARGDLPFLFYSAAFHDDEACRLAESLGGVRFLPKPQRLADLLAAVEEILASRPEPPPAAADHCGFDARHRRLIGRTLEEKVRELELYRRIVDGAMDGIALLDGEGCYLSQNPAHRRLFGYADEELAGRSIALVVDEGVEEILDQCRSRGRFHGRVTGVAKDGRRLCLEVAAATLSSPDAGAAPCRVVFCRDVTAEEEAQRRIGTLSRAVEQSPVGVMITDASGTIGYANPRFAEISGYGAEELAGMEARRLLSAGTPEQVYDEMWRTILAGRVWRGELLSRRKDGSEYWAEVRIAPLRADGGRIVNFVGYLEDATERRQWQEERALLERQLLHAQKMEALGTMAGGIAHDFNNILTAILGYVELAELQLPPGSPVLNDLRQVGEAGRRAAALVRQILFFSRRLPGQLTRRKLDLNEVVQEVLAMLQRIIGEDVRIESRLDPAAWPVGGDPELLTQMLVNLVVNARDAMPHGGTVVIATANRVVDAAFCAHHLEARPGQYCCLSVEDTGTGMDEVTLSRIFEPFFTTKETGKGSGLGLSVVYGLVRDLGGWIDVASRPRQGSRFSVYLPRYAGAEQEGSAAGKEGGTVSALPAGRNEQILVVEDDPDIRRIVVAYLEGHGYRPLAAATAEEAMVLLEEREGELDLVFADVVLPGRSGLELARQVQEICPRCRILLTSGYTDIKARIDEIEELGLPYIDKPYRLPTLLAHIHDLLH